jgi:hypothetical protein
MQVVLESGCVALKGTIAQGGLGTSGFRLTCQREQSPLCPDDKGAAVSEPPSDSPGLGSPPHVEAG